MNQPNETNILKGKKIGIMGGTFDPVHIGHLILAEAACEQHRLDVIYVMPNNRPRYKSDHPVTDVRHRLEMTRLAIEGNPRLVLSDIEVLRSGDTYTFETLKQLKQLQPEDTFYFILGADSLFSFENWKHPEEIAKNCVLLAANRNHTPKAELMEQMEYLRTAFHADVRMVHIPDIDISSSTLRQKAADGQSIRYYVPDAVYDYIKKEQLYW